MSNLPISSKYRSTPALPVSDEEREDLAGRLNQAFGDGTIDSDAYRGMLDRVFEAKTLGELVPVVEVLPVKQTYQAPAIVAQSGPAPGELTASTPPGKASLVAAGAIGGGLILIALILLLIVL